MKEIDLSCSHCFNEGTSLDGSFDLASSGAGFFCEMCDGFNYFDNVIDRHHFVCVAEDKASKQPLTRSSIKFKKQLSPYRYPGGKSKFIDYLYTLLRPGHHDALASPFTGGGSFELAMLESGVVKQLHLNDLDYGVFSLFHTILNDPSNLIDRINHIVPDKILFLEAKQATQDHFHSCLSDQAAWYSLVLNRLAFSGIPKANPMGGLEASSEKMLVRWNPETLIKRIEWIHSMREHITISCLPANVFIEEHYWTPGSTLFIDPPYIEKGKALYTHYFTEQDHYELASLLDGLHFGVPGADILLTYDAHQLLYQMYDHADFKIVGRNYSI